MMNMQNMMKQAQKLQKQMEQSQAELAATQFVGKSAQDLVVATLTGDKKVVSIDFNAAVVDPEDTETLSDMTVQAINAAALIQNYDFIVSTVVLMFLEAERIPAIIRNMQEHTNPGGYNLIVCAMDTEDYPCQIPFSFTFKEGELAEYYKDWELVKYNENPGHLHRRDENGNRIQLRFATMLAKKK